MTRHLSVVTPLQEWADHIAEVARTTFLGPFEPREPFQLYVTDKNGNLIVLAVVVEMIDIKSELAFGHVDEYGEIISINVKKDADDSLIATLP